MKKRLSKVDRLKFRVRCLESSLKTSNYEMWERGKELEKINKLVRNWQGHVPDEFYDGLTAVLDGYIKRCSMKPIKR